MFSTISSSRCRDARSFATLPMWRGKQRDRAHAFGAAEPGPSSPSAAPIADAGVDRPTRAVFTRDHGPTACAGGDKPRCSARLCACVRHGAGGGASLGAGLCAHQPQRAHRSPLHPWLAGIPIVDRHGLIAFDLFALFNDTFFMSLMFLLSGLFVGRAWRAKAAGASCVTGACVSGRRSSSWRSWRRSPTIPPFG